MDMRIHFPFVKKDKPIEEPLPQTNDISRVMTICNERGLHARAAAKFVRVAEAFNVDVVVRRKEMEVSGRSIMGLMVLSASCGTDLLVRAQGPDAVKALDALENLIARKFDEV